jgi:RecG-like helicase
LATRDVPSAKTLVARLAMARMAVEEKNFILMVERWGVGG